MELLILACLIAAPDQCRQERLPVVSEEVPPLSCMFIAPAIAAKWQEEHPKWRVHRFGCVPVGHVPGGRAV